MSTNENSETYGDVKKQIKTIQATCFEMCQFFQNNAPVELEELSLRSSSENTINYVDALATVIEEKETEALTCDENLETARFLCDLKERTDQVKQLFAFASGVVRDIDEEIKSLKPQLEVIKKVNRDLRQNTTVQKQQLKPENLQKARVKFNTLKEELQSLLVTLFPNEADAVKGVLAHLMQASMDETNSGYIELTEENSNYIEILEDIGLLKRNPYNKEEVKLAY